MTIAPRRNTALQRAILELKRAGQARLPTLWAIAVGIALGALSVAAKAVILALASDPGYALLLAAVIASSWLGGFVGGLATLATTLALNSLLLVDPIGRNLAPGGEELFKQWFFLAIGLGALTVVGLRRRQHDRLAEALARVAVLAEGVQSRDERLELVLAASRTGIWEWDIGSGALLWSDAILRQHGLEPGESAPDFETYLGMIHPDDRDGFREAIDMALHNDGQFELEFRIVWPDGSVHWTHGAGRVFRDRSGQPVRMVGTGQDISSRRNLESERDRLFEEEQRARAFREAFVDVVSHELRTPITAIVGLTQILARPGFSDDKEIRLSLLADVRAEGERLHRLVEDLLVLSRAEHGRLVIDAEPLELRRLLDRVVAREAAELPSITISLEIEPYLPIVAGDATYVEQVIHNMLGNASKYTPAGAKVTVSARSDGEEVAIRVSDDGPGVPDASLGHAFDLFYRDPDSARMVSGSGIGLFVCASLVRAMGGRIWVVRRPEGGSEFGFTLRQLEADDEVLTSDPEPMAESQGAPVL